MYLQSKENPLTHKIPPNARRGDNISPTPNLTSCLTHVLNALSQQVLLSTNEIFTHESIASMVLWPYRVYSLHLRPKDLSPRLLFVSLSMNKYSSDFII